MNDVVKMGFEASDMDGVSVVCTLGLPYCSNFPIIILFPLFFTAHVQFSASGLAWFELYERRVIAEESSSRQGKDCSILFSTV